VIGVLRDVADLDSLITTASADELDKLIDEGILTGGMIPKITSCTRAVRNGVAHAHILDGRVPHALLLEMFTRDGIETMVST
jgi:acetylglutamate kinase